MNEDAKIFRDAEWARKQQIRSVAPELLEALKISLVLLEKTTPFKGQEELLQMTVAMNREVIAKAEGAQ